MFLIKIKKTMLVASVGLFASLLLQATPAAATEFCFVKKTSDGFVALRKKPSTGEKIIGRMKAGDEVMLGKGMKGNWLEVTWWHADDRLTKGFDKKSDHGWVNRKLIEEECG